MNKEFKIKVIEYESGNAAAMGYIIGCLVKLTEGKINPGHIQEIVKLYLQEIRETGD